MGMCTPTTRWRLRHPSSEPPDGWKYFEDRTDITIKARDRHELVDKIIDHRKYKGLLPTNPNIVLKEIQQQICERLGGDASHCIVDRNG